MEYQGDYTELTLGVEVIADKGTRVLVHVPTATIVYVMDGHAPTSFRTAAHVAIHAAARSSIPKKKRAPVVDRNPPGNHREPILTFFRTHAPHRIAHVTEIAKAIRVKPGVASHWSARLEIAGDLIREQRGFYRLPHIDDVGGPVAFTRFAAD